MWLKVFNLESKFSPADSTRPPSLDYRQILIIKQFSPADSTRPPSLYYGQIIIIKQFSPADSGGHTRPPSLDLFSFFIPAESGGLWRNPHVTICDISGVRSIPPESGNSSGIRRNMWGSVKYCPLAKYLISLKYDNDSPY